MFGCKHFVAFLLVIFIATLIRISDFFPSIGGNQLQPCLPESEGLEPSNMMGFSNPFSDPYRSFVNHLYLGDNDAAIADFLNENVNILALFIYHSHPGMNARLFSDEAFRTKYIELLKVVARSGMQLDACPVAAFPIHLLTSQYLTENELSVLFNDADLDRYLRASSCDCPIELQELQLKPAE